MLADFLLGQFRTRVLSALLLHPDTAWHVRELARRLDALPGSINRELVKLADVGILSRQHIGNQVHYRANRDCPVFDELASLLRKTSGMASVLTEALQPLADHIQCAVIFGSVARGEETAHSDVDVLVLGDIGFGDVIEALHPAQDVVRREINPVVYKTEDFCAKLASNNTWAREVVEKSKLFLIGNADDFAKLVGHPESR
ncbi:nucleotidyltransferase domain-containing protein [Massilia sp. PAMC28688]|uniref:nucleotidyltransferase domain-containing protein n=1 Tax=Massilia sp. PAMC28688 TaxID=2861283 RepID=UPI001C6398A7|nr:nucleotidyltransferase domain-containing protein [Massilia sp. PAMC28688]QYF92299.1 nucleotidyltransferase domain-containing protein [Massilia sp. PAMC28688]